MLLAKNLLQEYGREEFSSRLMGSAIQYDGDVCLLQKDLGDGVSATRLTGTVDKIVKREVIIPYDFFVNVDVMKHPDLGWRVGAVGQYIAYHTKIPHPTRKGLAVGFDRDGRGRGTISTAVSNFSLNLRNYLRLNQDYYQQPSTAAFMLWKPEFHTLEDGLAKIKAGEIISFVIDNNFAVIPSSNLSNGKLVENCYLDIYYRTRRVGTVDRNGNIQFMSKWMQGAWERVNA